ncbi:MAG: hypothetical protein P9L95_05840 [Candidatus Tenebribacter mawsonii]|nr:hypothetical protein [Candidatus Tenebribacter mawsonii]
MNSIILIQCNLNVKTPIKKTSPNKRAHNQQEDQQEEHRTLQSLSEINYNN